MSDHRPIKALDLVPASAAIIQVAKELSKSMQPLVDAFSKMRMSDGMIGDSKHLWHYHISNFEHTITQIILYAVWDLREAELVVHGPDRHRAVKAARDELRRLRKLERRQRGW